MKNIEQQIKNSNSTYSRWWLNQLRKLKPETPRYVSLVAKIEKELQYLERRRQLIAAAKINYPDELPVSAAVTEIKELINSHQVVIVSGETGFG